MKRLFVEFKSGAFCWVHCDGVRTLEVSEASWPTFSFVCGGYNVLEIPKNHVEKITETFLMLDPEVIYHA